MQSGPAKHWRSAKNKIQEYRYCLTANTDNWMVEWSCLGNVHWWKLMLKKKKRKKKIILMSVKYWINGKCLTRLFFKKWRVYCTPSHTLGRVLSLVSMYSCFIRSSKFHLLFFLYSFMIRKVACSAGKCFYILLLIPFLLFVSFRFVSFPSLFLRTTSGFFLIIKILPKPIFISHKWIFKLYIDVNRCSFVTLILLK